MKTSLIAYDVELIITTVKYQLSKVWETVKNHRASILEKIQEVKTALEKLKIRAEKQQKDKPTQTRKGAHAEETVKMMAQGSVNFVITLEMLFFDEETTQ
jgi:hypothetical protein